MQFKLSTILPLIIGLILGISFTNLFKSCSNTDKPINIIPTVKTTTLTKQVTQAETDFIVKENALKKQQEKIQQELNSTKTALTKAKKTNTVLQTQLLDLLDQQNTAIENVDTSTAIQLIDSVENKVEDWITETTQKDSLYETNILQLENQVINKDSSLQLQTQLYQNLKTAFTQSELQQTILEQENKFYKKKIKQQKIKSKLISAALLILSGTAANYLLHQ